MNEPTCTCQCHGKDHPRGKTILAECEHCAEPILERVRELKERCLRANLTTTQIAYLEDDILEHYVKIATEFERLHTENEKLKEKLEIAKEALKEIAKKRRPTSTVFVYLQEVAQKSLSQL